MTTKFSTQISQGDALELLEAVAPESVHMAIMAPPVEINPLPYFQKLTRVMKRGGVVWYITNDDYTHPDLKGLPWSRVFALKGMGWLLRQDCVVSKTLGNKDATAHRPQNVHDYVFMLTRSTTHYFNRLDGLNRSVWHTEQEKPRGGYKYWTTPLVLVEMLVRMGSPKGGLVLDPFIGSGTTAIAAEKWGRRWIGFERDPKAVELAEKRIEEANVRRDAKHGRSGDRNPDGNGYRKTTDAKRRR